MNASDSVQRFSKNNVIQVPLMALKVSDLKTIIRQINEALIGPIKLTGVKADLINRIADLISAKCNANDYRSVGVILNIMNGVAKRERWLLRDGVIFCLGQMTAEEKNRLLVMDNTPLTAATELTKNNWKMFTWKPSPFYKIASALTPCRIVDVASLIRKSEIFRVSLTGDQRADFLKPHAQDGRPVHEIRFLCGSAGVGQGQLIEMEFPAICELRVNSHVWSQQALRGLKNKPGTVNPPDLTPHIFPNEPNRVELIYANTAKPYVCQIIMTRRVLISELVDQIAHLPKEDVLKKLQEWRDDVDIVMESETVSMRCPLGFTRIQVPCRSRTCPHLQCFDAINFLAMNEQSPTWSCPVCARKINSMDDLVKDGYFENILKTVQSNVEKVQIESDGRLQIVEEEAETTDDEEAPETVKKKPTQNIPELVTISDDDDDDNNSSNNGNDNNNNNNNNSQIRSDNEPRNEQELPPRQIPPTFHGSTQSVSGSTQPAVASAHVETYQNKHTSQEAYFPQGLLPLQKSAQENSRENHPNSTALPGSAATVPNPPNSMNNVPSIAFITNNRKRCESSEPNESRKAVRTNVDYVDLTFSSDEETLPVPQLPNQHESFQPLSRPPPPPPGHPLANLFQHRVSPNSPITLASSSSSTLGSSPSQSVHSPTHDSSGAVLKPISEILSDTSSSTTPTH